MDDEAAAINAPNGGMVPRDAPTFRGTSWIPSDLVFRPEWHLSQRPRAGMVSLVLCFEFVLRTCIGLELTRSPVRRRKAVPYLLVLGGGSEGL